MGNTLRPVHSATDSATSMQPSLAPTQAPSPTQSANGLLISPVSPTASPRSHSPTMSPRSRSNEPTHLPSTFPATAQSATTPIALSHPTGVHADSEPSNKLQNLQTGGNLDSYIFHTPPACKITPVTPPTVRIPVRSSPSSLSIAPYDTDPTRTTPASQPASGHPSIPPDSRDALHAAKDAHIARLVDELGRLRRLLDSAHDDRPSHSDSPRAARAPPQCDYCSSPHPHPRHRCPHRSPCFCCGGSHKQLHCNCPACVSARAARFPAVRPAPAPAPVPSSPQTGFNTSPHPYTPASSKPPPVEGRAI